MFFTNNFEYISFRLYITCDNKPHGCVSVVKLDCLKTHLEECDFNPKRPVPCEQGCGLVVPKDELKVSRSKFTNIKRTGLYVI